MNSHNGNSDKNLNKSGHLKQQREQIRASAQSLAISIKLFSMCVPNSDSLRNQMKQFTASKPERAYIYIFLIAQIYSE